MNIKPDSRPSITTSYSGRNSSASSTNMNTVSDSYFNSNQNFSLNEKPKSKMLRMSTSRSITHYTSDGISKKKTSYTIKYSEISKVLHNSDVTLKRLNEQKRFQKPKILQETCKSRYISHHLNTLNTTSPLRNQLAQTKSIEVEVIDLTEDNEIKENYI